jgi:hypothetical protein
MPPKKKKKPMDEHEELEQLGIYIDAEEYDDEI